MMFFFFFLRIVERWSSIVLSKMVFRRCFDFCFLLWFLAVTSEGLFTSCFFSSFEDSLASWCVYFHQLWTFRCCRINANFFALKRQFCIKTKTGCCIYFYHRIGNMQFSCSSLEFYRLNGLRRLQTLEIFNECLLDLEIRIRRDEPEIEVFLSHCLCVSSGLFQFFSPLPSLIIVAMS